MTTKMLMASVTIAAALVASSASASVLYSQAFDETGNAWTSQNDTNPSGYGNYGTSYDNFTLGSSATVTSVEFTGEFFFPSEHADITAFTLKIYADNAGQPGSAVYTQAVGGNANEVSLGSFGGYPTYGYSIATNFNAIGGTQYWLSVVADLVYPPQWGWSTSTQGDGAASQDFFGERSTLHNDLAFTLNGADAVVPEPGAWAMMILGFGMAGAMLRRRAAVAAG
jgi:hypothetical protein